MRGIEKAVVTDDVKSFRGHRTAISSVDRDNCIWFIGPGTYITQTFK